MNTTENLRPLIAALLQQAGFTVHEIQIEQCHNGKNNQTYRVNTDQGSFIAKKYFQNAEDERDRLNAEFSFLTYAKKVAPNQVPAAYCCDSENGLALYEFIDGEAFQPDAIRDVDIDQAMNFFLKLNDPKAKMQANALPEASEACFTIRTHIDLISARIKELEDIKPESTHDHAAKAYITQLNSFWQTQLEKIKMLVDFGEFMRPLETEQRCISPSDFGFHNALRRKDGSICFLDFEYAGWDDPAKMSGDFFSQLAVPVPQKYFDYFVQQVMGTFAKPDILIERAHHLRYLYQVKWCCIILNIFLPTHMARRKFSNPELNVDEIKEIQLAKAAAVIKTLETISNGND